MDGMDGMAVFYSARLDEAEENAWAVHAVAKCDALLYAGDMGAAARLGPDCDCGCGYAAAVLRGIAAKRAILALHRPPAYTTLHDAPDDLSLTEELTTHEVTGNVVRILAAEFAGHPDYRERWKP